MIPIIRSPDIDSEIRKLHATPTLQDHTDLTQTVAQIGQAIYQNRDAAVIDYTHRFDGVSLTETTLRVSVPEIQSAYDHVSESFISAFKRSIANIRWFHQHQLPQNWSGTSPDGAQVGYRYTPIESVGLYVPGGRAIYPSSVAMNAIPAMIAGVRRVVMVSPAQPNGQLPAEVVVAADLCGVTEMYKVGGAQAIFALAYGTPRIPKVDKIVGPGNKYVTQAKQQVLGLVAIDKPAGPSEVAIYLETEPEAVYAAADMLAQLEHDPDANAVAVCANESVLVAINRALSTLIQHCKRRDIIEQSLQNARLFHVKSLDEALSALTQLASEHVVIMGSDPHAVYSKIPHGGAFFLGPYSPVTLGDYIAGTNHVLPTAGTARFSSPLNVMDYLKGASYVQYSKSQLDATRSDIAILTAVEGLDAHRLNVEVRFDNPIL